MSWISSCHSMTWKKVKVAQSCPTVCNPMDYTDHGILQVKLGSCSLLQGIFPTQGSNSGLLCCKLVLYQLSHQGSPRMLEWAAHPFSTRSSHPGIELGSTALQADSLPTERWLTYLFSWWQFFDEHSFTFDQIHFLIFKNFYAFCVLSKESLFIKIFSCVFLFSF